MDGAKSYWGWGGSSRSGRGGVNGRWEGRGWVWWGGERGEGSGGREGIRMERTCILHDVIRNPNRWTPSLIKKKNKNKGHK